MRIVAVAVVVVVGLCAGCPPAAQCEKKDNMLKNDAWTLVAPADDPFADDAPKPLVIADENGHFPVDDADGDTPHNVRVCGDAAVYTEVLDGDESLTVDTNICGWATTKETLALGVDEGATMFARVFYFQQVAPGIADAHLVFTVDNVPFWQETIPLPQPSTLIAKDFAAPFAAKEGAELMWHVDNHGVNTWNLFEMSVTTPIVCPTEPTE